MAKSKRFSGSKSTKNTKLKSISPSNTGNEFFVISFGRIIPGDFCYTELDINLKASMAEAIFMRKSITWNEIDKIDRRTLGYEKLEAANIKAPAPKADQDIQEKYYCFRFANNDGRMVGYRRSNIFYILWIEKNKNLYDHGS